ncbi:hypothetical protein PR048_008348 [Dryococelus australis]|uniref:Uncharacterized protein n=1 Tax=Dryococelus australis TaxID=614101 RepID=A0ABQ9HWV4_9NEOP|nr:hypothetical protein PR048_008348 [Dryococelus australis]
MHLDVHLENGQIINFNPEDNVEIGVENPRNTTLMFWHIALLTNKVAHFRLDDGRFPLLATQAFSEAMFLEEDPRRSRALQTHQAACLAFCLLENDNHWHETLTEASLRCGAPKLRELFANMLVFCNISNPLALWESFRENFSEDLIRDFTRHPDININTHMPEINNHTLILLQDVVVSLSNKTINKFGLPAPQITSQFTINR